MDIGYYYSMIDESTQTKVLPIITYIQTKYDKAVYDEKYTDKTKIPTWRLNDSYISIACRRKYISIHFGNYDAVTIVTNASPKIRGNIGCVNIGYNVDIPYNALYRAIDLCFYNIEHL